MLIDEDFVFEALRPIVDPEVNFSIVDMGLIYGIDFEDEGKKVIATMTLTSPMCPFGPQIVTQVDETLKALPMVEDTDVKVVWEPQWDPRTMASDEIKDRMGIW